MIRTALRHSIRLVPWQVRSSIKRLPVVSWLQRKLLTGLLTGHEFSHRIDAGPARGLIFPVVLPIDKGVWTGTYELSFVQRLSAAVKPGDTCFDIGGWRGYCAGVMACSGAARTVVFEPLPANGERIRRLISLNPHLPSISLEACAVGEADGVAVFRLMPESSMGKLDQSPFQASETSSQSIEIPVISLDSFCKSHEIPTVNLIKLDVEGAEMMALRGATQLIERCRPRLFIEAHSRALTAEVTAFLSERGYRLEALETGRPPDGHSEPEVCHLEAMPA